MLCNQVFVEHGSVQACLSAGSQPVDLASCLRAFTSEERLEARYHCGPCSALQPATKKLQMWRLPPVLVSIMDICNNENPFGMPIRYVKS